eukprot:SAG31_NODE_1671_length_7565_cov_7.868203_3_plen_207_part_00
MFPTQSSGLPLSSLSSGDGAGSAQDVEPKRLFPTPAPERLCSGGKENAHRSQGSAAATHEAHGSPRAGARRSSPSPIGLRAAPDPGETAPIAGHKRRKRSTSTLRTSSAARPDDTDARRTERRLGFRGTSERRTAAKRSASQAGNNDTGTPSRRNRTQRRPAHASVVQSIGDLSIDKRCADRECCQSHLRESTAHLSSTQTMAKRH